MHRFERDNVLACCALCCGRRLAAWSRRPRLEFRLPPSLRLLRPQPNATQRRAALDVSGATPLPSPCRPPVRRKTVYYGADEMVGRAGPKDGFCGGTCVLTVVNVQIGSDWLPRPGTVWLYLRLQIAMGLAPSTLAVVGLTGIVGRE